jgi:hypothetical protein
MPPEGLEFGEGVLINNDTGDIIGATHGGGIVNTAPINWEPLRIVDPRDERITELEHQVEALLQMVEHLRIQAKEAGVAVEPMTLSEMLTNSE